ncbi:hypothetical protein C1A34_01500 [Lactobacillus amylovorus]|nr:hypothetical protein C1A34_01500 [Lactobacillus amylovorus]
MFNMFVMKRDAFDSYCEFIFGVLKDVESRVDIADYSVQEKRVFGYIFELFMDVWLDTTKQKYTEVKWKQLGGENNIVKAISLIERKFGIKTKTHF